MTYFKLVMMGRTIDDISYQFRALANDKPLACSCSEKLWRNGQRQSELIVACLK